MGPYSHFILASKIEKQLQPENAGAYYWGAVIPDIRYLAKMRRDHTHLEPENIQRLAEDYPHLKSFLMGYQVHCLIDQVDVAQLVSTAFPLNILKIITRRNFPQPQVAMLVEMHYLQAAASPTQLSGDHNEVIRDLGITEEQTGVYFQAMQSYINSHSLDSVISTFQNIGMIENGRIGRYLSVYQSMRKKKLLKAVLMFAVKNARLDQQVTRHITSNINGVA